jgi:hypothetical protein
MEKSANPKTKVAYSEASEPAAKILARLLDDMEFLGLIEFKADAKDGPCWVIAKQKPEAEPIKQGNVLFLKRRLG